MIVLNKNKKSLNSLSQKYKKVNQNLDNNTVYQKLEYPKYYNTLKKMEFIQYAPQKITYFKYILKPLNLFNF